MSPLRTRISLVQQGIIAQNEFAKLLMMGSRGLIELAAPLTDEERRDFEVHLHGMFGSALAVQVKSVLQLAYLSTNARYLRTRISVRASRLVSDPLFWYFFAFLDPKTMRFADPAFLVPSLQMHEAANPIRHGGFWNFTFEASMEPGSHDRWVPNRVNTLDLGKTAVAIMKAQASSLPRLPGSVGVGAGALLALPDVVWVRKH
jgi:hypothetical protein